MRMKRSLKATDSTNFVFIHMTPSSYAKETVLTPGPYKNTNHLVTNPKQLLIKTYFFDSFLT